MLTRILFVVCILSLAAFSQMPAIEPGVSLELAKWRAARYSDVRYKLNLTLEKMSPVLKGSMEIRVNLSAGTQAPSSVSHQSGDISPIILDWRKIKGHEEKSTVSNVLVNGKPVSVLTNWPPTDAGGSDYGEHLIFRDGVVAGENVIKLDFTSPILTSGSAITRYIDKEDGAEYIYSLFVPSDASTAFPVFDQPDLKARFKLFVTIKSLVARNVVSNTEKLGEFVGRKGIHSVEFAETLPISTYLLSFAAGNFVEYFEKDSGGEKISRRTYYDNGTSTVYEPRKDVYRIYVRQSQEQKFTPHSEEIFRLNREAVKYFETYFDYKFPFPKYDLVLIPEFPFGGMEHAGATFLREASIIFPQDPTRNDHISRATLIFHEAAHQWFGDTVTMKWFDDLWLKEGFATFMAYKAMEKTMPEMNAWEVFYERVKQAAYQTDSTRGTTPIYQEIKNLSAAKSAYGNIVYNKAPAFLRQAEFYLGEDKFQTAVRAFLKKHEFANAGWEDLVKEFETAGWKVYLKDFANKWVTQRGLPVIKIQYAGDASEWTDRGHTSYSLLSATFRSLPSDEVFWLMNINALIRYSESMPDRTLKDGSRTEILELGPSVSYNDPKPKIKNTFTELIGVKTLVSRGSTVDLVFPNYGDHGYGIFLLDDKSRDYVLKNIGSEKDDFLRSMMWGSLWDSVREGELDPRVYVELAIKNLPTEQDETIVSSILSRVGTAMNYYLSERVRSPTVKEGAGRLPPNTAPSLMVGLRTRLEAVLIDRMQNAPTAGQRITFFRAFLNVASSEKARGVLKGMLATDGNLSGSEGAPRSISSTERTLPIGRVSASGASIPLKSKDRFDIVTRLLILGDPDAPKLLANLEKTDTSDDARRYGYAAKAGFATAENKAKYWNDFVNNAGLSESWIEAAFGPWNSIRHNELTLPYLQRALKELPNHKRGRKIFFVNGWLAAFIGGQRSEAALAVVNKFLADNPNLDNDLRLKILENADLIERAVRIRAKYAKN